MCSCFSGVGSLIASSRGSRSSQVDEESRSSEDEPERPRQQEQPHRLEAAIEARPAGRPGKKDGRQFVAVATQPEASRIFNQYNDITLDLIVSNRYAG